MPVPLLVPLAIAGAAKAGAAIAKGVSEKKAAKAAFSPEQEAELAELEARRKAGDLGLTEQEQAAIEARFRAGNAAEINRQQLAGIQQASAGGDLRTMFLNRLAQQQAGQEAVTQKNIAIQDANAAAKAQELSRLDALRAYRSQSAQAQKQAVGTAVGGTLSAAGDAAQALYTLNAQAELAKAATGTATTEELLNQWDILSGRGDAGAVNPYSIYGVS